MSASSNESASVSSNVLFSLTEQQKGWAGLGWAGGPGVMEGTTAQER